MQNESDDYNAGQLDNYQPHWQLNHIAIEGEQDSVTVLTSADPFEPRTKVGSRFHEGFEYCYHQLGERANTQIAVDYGSTQVTYAELFNRANQMAWYFQQLAIPAGARIALLLDRSIDSYAAVLAASKISAAYVPLDASFPQDRILYMLEDSDVEVVLTLRTFTDIFAGSRAQVLALEESYEAIASCPLTPFDTVTAGVELDPLAYLIYTSGSTGKPKGVPIRHSSICNFMDVATRLYGYVRSDRVYQGLTIAFDFSFEEVWIPLFTGASLVPAPPNVKLVGCDLGEYLAKHDVTALCCTPTMLSTLEGDLPKLRFMLLSGEACPADVVAPWLTPERRILNVYGPTETTVTATWSVVESGKPITIGGPLPTYDIVVINPDTGKAVAQGATGEVCIAGVGLCDDYLNRPEKTAEAFMPDFIGLANNPSKRLYRTGDLGRINERNEIEYLGRIDTQVKIRGYRIELEEIESVARSVKGIEQAVVQPFEIDGAKTLVAFLTAEKTGEEVDIANLVDTLKTALPPYMVPSYFEQLDEIPVLPSGKTNRNALKAPTGPKFIAAYDGDVVAPSTPLEKELSQLLAHVLKLDEISVTANFFEQLGADSLSMAAFVTAVRNKMGIKQLSMRQLYEHPSITTLAKNIECLQHLKANNATNDSANPKVLRAADRHADTPHIASDLARYSVGVAQVIITTVELFLFTWLAVYLFHWVTEVEGFINIVTRSLSASILVFFATSAAFILIKWLAIGKFTTEPIKIWSFNYLRFWVAQRAIQLNPLNVFLGSPVYSVYLRLLGMRVGKHTSTLSASPICTDLISIGDNTILRQNVTCLGYTAANGYLYPGTVNIGSNVTICEDTVLDINTSVGDNAQLGLVSSLREGESIPENKVYQGTPAEPSTANFNRVPPRNVSPLRVVTYVALNFVYQSITAAFVLAIAITLLHFAITNDILIQSNVLIYSPILFITGLAIGMLTVSTLPRLLNAFIKAETVQTRYTFQYALVGLINTMTNSKFFNQLFGDSSLAIHWLSMVGYDLKKTTQTGSNFGLAQTHHHPYLCDFGKNTMVADGLNLLNTEVSTTSYIVRKIHVLDNTYFGNTTYFPGYANIGENCLIATKAAIPVDGQKKHNTGLLGSPVFEIPRSVARDKQFDHYKQPEILKDRLAKKLRVNLVTMGLFLFRAWLSMVIAALIIIESIHLFGVEEPNLNMALTAFELTCAVIVSGFVLLLIGILSERAVCGFKRLQPKYCSIYEPDFWAHERFWKMGTDEWLASFNGTPFKSFFLRLQGMKVGKRLFDNGAGFAEATMVEIGDDCTLNSGTYIQCHSLEDGTFKSDHVRLKSYCNLGVMTFVQYGAVMENKAVLEANGVLMKGSVIASNTTWAGNPAKEV